MLRPAIGGNRKMAHSGMCQSVFMEESNVFRQSCACHPLSAGEAPPIEATYEGAVGAGDVRRSDAASGLREARRDITRKLSRREDSKTVKDDFGEMVVETPPDRTQWQFRAQILPKHQTRFKGFDDKIVSMRNARKRVCTGMKARDPGSSSSRLRLHSLGTLPRKFRSAGRCVQAAEGRSSEPGFKPST
jgi:hypothetical protein